MAKKKKDITSTGPMSYRELQAQNNLDNIGTPTLDQLEFINRVNQINAQKVASYESGFDINPQYIQSPLMQQGNGDYWGNSIYDEDVARGEQNLSDTRAENQPWYSQIAAGLAKGALLAGTTFLDGTLGLIVGANTAINEGRWSGLWDNDFSKAMQSINEWSESAMPNYYTEAEQNEPWYNNIFTANFLGDKFIKNLGFTVGAFYSGGIYSKGIEAALKLAKAGAKASTIVTSGIGATLSAVNEGRIEALNNSKDWYESTLAPIQDDYQQRRAALEEIGDYDSITELDSHYEKTLANLNEDRLKMGNADLLMNIPILTASNLIQFGKLYANGFRTGRRANNIVGNITDGYKGLTTRGTGIRKAILSPLSEGAEEISQSAASRIAGDYYQTDVNNFYKAKTDPDAQEETLSWWKSFAQGINETVNDGSAWEEFFIGTLTGAMGMPRFRGVRNEQGKFQSPITLEGGILGELRDNREQIEREQQIVDYMNNRIQSPEFRNYYQGLSRHRYYQASMDQAAQDNDEFAFKNAEQAQFISDVAMFDAAGKIEDLTTLINSAYDISDENLESIAKNTTSVITAEQQTQQINDVIQVLEQLSQDAMEAGDNEALNYAATQIQTLEEQLSNLRDIHVGPFVDHDGNPLYATEQGKQEMINKLTKTKDEMIGQIDDYVKTKIDLLDRLPHNIGNDQLEELIFLQTQVNNWDKRGEEMTPIIKGILSEASASLRTLASAQELAGNIEDSEKQNSNAQFIEQLVQDNTPKQLMQILSHPENGKLVSQISNIIGAYGNDVINNLGKQSILRMLDDIVKIGKSKDLYQKRLQEYIANPSAQTQAHEQAREQQENVRKVSNDISTIDRVNNSSVSDIVTAIDEDLFDISDEFESLLQEEENSEARDKVQQARDIIDTSERIRNDLEELASLDEISEQELNDAIALLNNSRAVAESAEELLDLDTEAFNDPHTLDDVDARETVAQVAERDGMTLEEANQEYNSIMSQRIDAAKNLISVVKSKQQQIDDQLSEIPSPSPQPIQTTETTQTGHDSVDKNEPVNAPATPQNNTTEANRELTDKTLAKYGHSREQSPQLAKDFDNIFSYVDRGIAKGVNDKDILDALAKTQTYQRLDQLQYPMKSLIQRAVELKRQGTTDTIQNDKPITTPIDQTPDTSISYENEIDRESKRNDSQSTEAYVESTRAEGTTTSIGKVEGTYNYWRPSTTEFPIHRERGNNTPYWQTVNSPARARYQAVYEYLKNNGAFDRVNNDKVKKGDEVHFGISKELSEKVGKPIILLLNSDNEVIGDLPMPEDANFNSYVGLPQLYASASDWYQKNRNSQQRVIATRSQSNESGRTLITEVVEVSRDVDSEGTTYVTLSERVQTDSSGKISTGRELTTGGLEISLDSIDYVGYKATGTKVDGSKVTRDDITQKDVDDAKDEIKTLLLNTSNKVRPFKAWKIYYAKDGRILAVNKEGLTVPLLNDPLAGKGVSSSNSDIIVIPGYKSNVARNMVGKPQYTSQDERHTLNQISTVTASDGTQKQVPFRLGIAIANADSDRVRIMSDAGRSKSQGASPLERTIIAPLRAVKGQPFLLMPTSSKTRAFIPVPIMMPKFDASNPTIANSSLGQEVSKKVQELSIIPNNTDQIMKWIDSMQELLAIPEIHINFSNLTLGLNGRKPQDIIVTIKKTDETKQTVLYKGPQNGDITSAVLNGLSGSMFQVSRKYINDTYNGRSYNEMIGELAETNLPIGATHTINDWFTIDPIVDRKQQKAHSPKSTRVNPTQTQGTVVRFQDTSGNNYYMTNSNRLYKENPEGNDIELLDDKYNYLKAHAYGARIGEPLTRPYDTPWGYYNPQTGKFQSKEPKAGETSSDTVGASPVALEYLLENGKGTIESLGYFLHGVAAAYPSISNKIESIRSKHKDILGESPSAVSNHKDLIDELKSVVEKAYGKEGVDILNELINNSTGFVPKEGKQVAQRIENLKPVESTPQAQANQPQITREEAMKDLKSKGLLNKKERNAALDKLSDDRLTKVAGMPKLKARQILERFDTRIKSNMDSNAINEVFDSVVGSKPLNREVVKQMAEERSWSREAEIKKMSKVLPQLSEDGRVRVVNGLIRIVGTKNPSYAWGQFQDGIITLSDRAARGTMYHESFHFVTQALLTQKELDNLYNSAEKQYGKLKRLELEEKLAEDFREFMQSYEDDGFFKNIFKTLKHIIKNLFGKETITNKLFHDIRRGAFASRTINSSDNTLYRKDPMTLQKELDNLRRLWRISKSKQFQSEMKKFNSKVNRNWDAAYSIIDKYGLRDVAYVFEGQYGAAKIAVQSLDKFTEQANRLKAQIQDAYESELSDDERLSNWALEQQETYYREIEQYHREKFDYGRLNQEQREYITERGLTLEEYNSMTPQEKEVLFRCMY